VNSNHKMVQLFMKYMISHHF